MKTIASWIIAVGIPVILISDLVIHLTGHMTISEQLWDWSSTGWGRLVPFSLGFLTAHLLLGKSGNA